jgi:stearoyl-CoA desaturase (delta-9 desaturase)
MITSEYWFIILIGGILLYFPMHQLGASMGYHKLFSHKSFEPQTWFPPVSAFIGIVSFNGDPLTYSLIHRIHHKYADTDLDPHGPGRGLKSILVIFHRWIDISDTPVNMRRIVELSQEWGWLHRFFLLFVIVNAGLLYLISWKVFLFLWWIPASISCWGVAGAVITQHWGGHANNGWNHRWFLYYEALHLHHHNYPRAPNTAILPGEIDYTFQASKIFRPKYYWEGQPNHDA